MTPMTHTHQHEQGSLIEVTPAGLSAYTPHQQHALTRYARFDRLRRQELPKHSAGAWEARLIHKSLYSAYLDCVEAGVGEEARLFGARPEPDSETGPPPDS